MRARIKQFPIYGAHMDLGKYTDLPSALGFAPDKNAKISKSLLFEVFGKMPKFPTDFKWERRKSWVHES